jgi:hypothetical protein
VKIFHQIVFGQWFRHFTGVVEILGGVLVMIPWTVTPGLALLALHHGLGHVLWATPLGQPANGIITGAFCVA